MPLPKVGSVVTQDGKKFRVIMVDTEHQKKLGAKNVLGTVYGVRHPKGKTVYRWPVADKGYATSGAVERLKGTTERDIVGENIMQDKFSALLEAISGGATIEEAATPEGLKKGVLETLKWLSGDIREATAAAFKVQPEEFSKEPLNVAYNALGAVRSLLSEAVGILKAMERDPTMAGVASQQNVIHLRSLVKKMGMRWMGEGLESEEVLSEDVPWEEMDIKKLPPDAKKVVSTVLSANGGRLTKAYRWGGDIKLVFSRPGGIYLNKYQMQKLIKVFGRDDDVIGDSTNSGYVVVLH